MELLGKSLKTIKKERQSDLSISAFSLHTSIAVGLQMLDALKDVHSAGFLHR
jgi:hypothetical protein